MTLVFFFDAKTLLEKNANWLLKGTIVLSLSFFCSDALYIWHQRSIVFNRYKNLNTKLKLNSFANPLCQNYYIKFTVLKSSQNWSTFVIFVNNRPTGENSLNLVALVDTPECFFFYGDQ
jgi:hypothetical protein